MRVSELLNRGMHRARHADETVMMIGEDIADPYGGAFKVSRGLSDTFPARVFSTPIAEAGITGFANGVALAGGRPVVEVMLGDFSTLVTDQIINHAAKFHFMYGGQVSLPLTLRVVSGGYGGYGATHSQSMEAYFCGTPGLKVVAISGRHNVEEMRTRVVLYESCPAIFVENKQLYAKRPQPHPPRGFRFVNVRSNDRNVLPPLEEELHFDYFVLSQLSPLDVTPLVQSAAKTKRVITVEVGPVSFGIGAEIVAGIAKQLNGEKLQTVRVGARDLPIPSSSVQEREVLPSVKDVLQAIIEIL